jgi:hypothetical protein
LLPVKSMRYKINWDALGIATSVACAIHCAVLPLLLTSLPVFGVNIVENAGFEFLMIALAFAIGLYALYHGFRKHHRKILPVLLFSAGISFLLAKQCWLKWHLWFLIPAVILIVTAHYINYLYCRKANRCHTSDCKHG